MDTTTSAAREWLIPASARSLLSQQLRTVGRSLLNEIRARHFPPPFAYLLTNALRAPGKLLSSQVMSHGLIDEKDLRLWPLLALLAAVSATGMPPATLSRLPSSFWRRARAAAVAAEFLGVALDGIDDVQDGDSPFVFQVGSALALNGSIALLVLVPLVLDQARQGGWPASAADAAHKLLFSSLLTSLEGQFLDLHFERLTTITEPAVIAMTEKKSGTLRGLVCQLGALSALSPNHQRPTAYFEEINRFGWYMGVWSQVLNDLHDAEITQGRPEKNDRQREKKTLPLLMEQHVC